MPKSKHRKKPKDPNFLKDHKQVGRKLIAPMNHMIPGGMTPISYRDTSLPEMFWLHILLTEMGPRATADFIHEISEIFSVLFPRLELQGELPPLTYEELEIGGDPKINPALSLSTSYGLLDDDVKAKLIEELKKLPAYETVRRSLTDYLLLFSECPLVEIFPPTDDIAESEFVEWMDVSLANLLDSRGPMTSKMLAVGVAGLMMQGKFLVPQNFGIDLNAVFGDPDSDEARKAASFCRTAGLTMGSLALKQEAYKEWSKYFWNKCSDLKPVDFSYLED